MSDPSIKSVSSSVRPSATSTSNMVETKTQDERIAKAAKDRAFREETLKGSFQKELSRIQANNVSKTIAKHFP